MTEEERQIEIAKLRVVQSGAQAASGCMGAMGALAFLIFGVPIVFILIIVVLGFLTSTGILK